MGSFPKGRSMRIGTFSSLASVAGDMGSDAPGSCPDRPRSATSMCRCGTRRMGLEVEGTRIHALLRPQVHTMSAHGPQEGLGVCRSWTLVLKNHRQDCFINSWIVHLARFPWLTVKPVKPFTLKPLNPFARHPWTLNPWNPDTPSS